MSWVKPKPLVKRRHCFELDERIDAYGRVVKALDEAEVRAVAARIRGDAGDPCRRRLPLVLLPQPCPRAARPRDPDRRSCPTCRSPSPTPCCPKWKEYERASTTIADAYLKPVVEPPAQGDAGPARRRPAQRPHRGHEIERRRDDARRRGRGAGQHGRLGPDGRSHRQPLRHRPRGHRASRHARHGRHLDRRLDHPEQPPELHHCLRDRVGRADPDTR